MIESQSSSSLRYWRLHIVGYKAERERESVMMVLEANTESRNEAKMENDTGSAKRRHCLRATVNVMSFVFSLLSFAFCFLLSFQTREIKDRVVDLEIGSGARLLSPFHGISMDQFNSMVQERMDELLSQVCNASTALTH